MCPWMMRLQRHERLYIYIHTTIQFSTLQYTRAAKGNGVYILTREYSTDLRVHVNNNIYSNSNSNVKNEQRKKLKKMMMKKFVSGQISQPGETIGRHVTNTCTYIHLLSTPPLYTFIYNCVYTEGMKIYISKTQQNNLRTHIYIHIRILWIYVSITFFVTVKATYVDYIQREIFILSYMIYNNIKVVFFFFACQISQRLVFHQGKH